MQSIFVCVVCVVFIIICLLISGRQEDKSPVCKTSLFALSQVNNGATDDDIGRHLEAATEGMRAKKEAAKKAKSIPF